MKKITIISASARRTGNSETLAHKFEEGAIEKGNEVHFLSLADIDLKFCKGCFGCQVMGNCIINDDVKNYLDLISTSDILVFATPIYFYEISGQLKTFLDRLNPLFIRANKFKEVYLLASCSESLESTGFNAKNAVQGWVSNFDGVVLKDFILATHVTDTGDINGTRFLELAYNLGRSIN